MISGNARLITHLEPNYPWFFTFAGIGESASLAPCRLLLQGKDHLSIITAKNTSIRKNFQAECYSCNTFS